MKTLLNFFRRRPLARPLALIVMIASIAATTLSHPGRDSRAATPQSRPQNDHSNLREFLFAPAPNAPRPLFLQLDTDGDGRLAPWEIEWAAESLRAMDLDQDGWIGDAEIASMTRMRQDGRSNHSFSPPPPPPPHRHRRLIDSPPTDDGAEWGHLVNPSQCRKNP